MVASSQGFVNEAYPPSDVGRWIAEIDAEGDPDGDGGFGLLPADGSTVIGVNQLLFHKGYMIAPLARNAAARGDGTRRGAMASFDISNLSDIKRSFFRQDDLTNEIREAHGLVLSTGDLLCINTITGVQFWNVSDPTDIRLVSDLRIEGMNRATYGTTGWWVMGQHPYYYLGSTQRGLHIIKAVDPANPVVVKRLEGSSLGISSIGSVHCIGNLMVLGSAGQSESTTGPFATLDISDPENPRLLDLASGTGNYSVGVYGNYITTHGGGGLTVWDMADPSNLQPIHHSPGMTEALYSCFADKHFHIPNFRTYEKFDFPIPAAPLLVTSGIPPIDKVHEFTEKLGNLIVATGGGDGDGVKFIPHQTEPDKLAPEVNFVSPAHFSTNQGRQGRIGVIVSDTLDFETVSPATFIVRELGGGRLDGAFSYSRNYLNFIPSVALKENTTYELIIPEGGIKDIVGNGILSFSSRFSTGPEVLQVQEPLVAITSPATDGKVPGSFELKFSVHHFELGFEGRSLNWFVDGVQGGMATHASPISITGLEPGRHSVRIDLMRNGDATGLSASSNFEVSIPAPNKPPRINLVVPALAMPSSSVRLDASTSSDPDQGPGPLTFQWQLLAGPAEVTFDSGGMATTMARMGSVGDYDFRLTTTDGQLAAVRDFRIKVREVSKALLMVTETGGFIGGDLAIRNHLVARGASVVGMPLLSVTREIAEGYSLMLVSDTISKSVIQPELRDAMVPMMVWEPNLYDDLGLTGKLGNHDFGTLSLTSAGIVETPNALTAGLPAGPLDLFNTPALATWGRPGKNAVIGVSGGNGQSLLFGYDEGKLMVTGVAHRRRIGMMAGNGSFGDLTPAGLLVFDSAFDWVTAVNGPLPTPDPEVTPEPALTISLPSAGATLTGSFPVVFSASHFALGSGGRSLAWFVDGVQRGTSTNTLPISITGLAAGPRTIRLELLQNGVATGVSSSVTVMVEIPPPPPNQAPRITLVAPASAFVGNTVALDARQSSDPDNGPAPLTFRWEMLTGPSPVAPTPAAASSTTVKLAGKGDYHFRLTVGDGDLSVIRDFKITVQDTPREVLVVTPNGSFAGGDVNLRNHLTTRGLAVVGIGAGAVTKTVAERYGLVIVSGTISSPRLNLDLTGAAVPVMVCESYVFDDFGMTARVENVDFGNLSLNRAVIPGAANVLTAGLAPGESILFSKVSPLPWGRPGPGAIVGAATASGQALVFGYERGAAMLSGSAPARRMGMMLGENSFALLTPAGLALFNNALDWVNGTGVPEVVPEPEPTAEPSLTITSPVTGATLIGDTPVSFSLLHFALGSGGRSLAWFVDGVQRGTSTNTLPISITGLAAGPRTIRLELLQNGVATGVSSSVTVMVEIPPPPPNQAPRITLVAPASAFVGNTVALDARQSSDPDNGPAPLTFRWEMLAGPSPVTPTTPAASSTAVKLAGKGDYHFRLTVGDGDLSVIRDFKITAQDAPREVLVVTPNGSFAGGDVNLRNHLTTRGLAVVGIGAGAVTKTVAERYGLVIVSGTISSPRLNLDLTGAAVPVMVCESYVFDDFGMTARVENVDFGNLSLNRAVIPGAANVLTAGLAPGENILFSKVSPLPWGRPGPGAIVGAATASGQALVFGYERGAAMLSGSAPARRVGMMLGENSFALLTPAGLALFNNALDWVTGTGAHGNVALEISESLSFGPLVTSQTPVVLEAAIKGGTGRIEYSWEITGADGISSQTPWSASNLLSRVFSVAGNHTLILRVRDDADVKTKIIRLVVHAPLGANLASSSSGFALASYGLKTVWNVNPDNDSVTVLDATTLVALAEIPVAADPRSLVGMPNDEVWVASHDAPAVTMISQATRSVIGRIDLPRGSAPEGMVTAGNRSYIYLALRGTGGIAKINFTTRQVESILSVAPTPKGLAVDPSGMRLFVTHFISPDEAGKVTEVDLTTFTVTRVIDLAISTRPDSISSGRGLPNYLGHPGISPDGSFLLIPSKQDNILRGTARDGFPLTSENTVRSVVSKVDLATGAEVPGARWDINDSDSPNAVAFSPLGNLVFVSLQGTNSVAVLDAYNRREVARFEVEAAPDALLVDRDSGVLYVHQFLDRSVSAYSIGGLSMLRAESPILLGKRRVVTDEKLDPQVMLGKRVFYNAADPRMSSNGYISCASCHLDGDGDGRVWDFTDRGEGLRNTIDLRGRSGTGHGRIHWSGNFDEVQDFENDIRLHFGGLGFMSQSAFHETSAPLGEPKSGRSVELDALAAYVASLNSVPKSPYRNSDGSLTTGAARGREIFESLNCTSCHTGEEFTDSARMVLHDVGTLKPGSGARAGDALTGIDTPTLKGLWVSAPYFHDGSAKTLRDVVEASGPEHGNMAALDDAGKNDIIAYLYQIEQSDSNPRVAVLPKPINERFANARLPARFAGDGAVPSGSAPVENLSSGVLPFRDGEVGYFEVQVRILKGLEIGSMVQTSPDCRVWKSEAAQKVMLDDSGASHDVVGFRVPLAGRPVLFVRIPIRELEPDAVGE